MSEWMNSVGPGKEVRKGNLSRENSRYKGTEAGELQRVLARVMLLVRAWRAEFLGGSGASIRTGLGEAELGVGPWTPLPDSSQAKFSSICWIS